jgi:hypothetical protein
MNDLAADTRRVLSQTFGEDSALAVAQEGG